MKRQSEVSIGDIIILMWVNGPQHGYPPAGTLHRVTLIRGNNPLVSGINDYIEYSATHWKYYEGSELCYGCKNSCKSNKTECNFVEE